MTDTTTTPAPDADKAKDAPKDDKATEPKTPETKSTETSKSDDVEFDGPFDEDRAKRLIAKLRDERKADKERLAEIEKAEQAKREAEMTEAQKAAARAEKAEQRAAELERELLITKVSKDTAVPEDLLKESGHKDEKGLREYAGKLSAFKGAAPATDKPKPPGSKPKPGMKPGSGETADNANDVESIAARIKSRRRF